MNQTTPSNARAPIAGYLVGGGFLLTAIALVTLSPDVDLPIHDQPLVRVEQIVPGAWRTALSDPPMINIGTLNQRCNDCHTLFENTRDPDRALNQHTEIVLRHGSNDGCLDCHDKDDREKLTLRGGKVVGYDHVEQLCGQCHGPIFRDWKKGSHGKTVGYWNSDFGEPNKLTCTECHDPHAPAYDPMAPLPGPNTLRMGKQDAKHMEEMVDSRNPLQRWRLLEHAESGDTEHGSGHE